MRLIQTWFSGLLLLSLVVAGCDKKAAGHNIEISIEGATGPSGILGYYHADKPYPIDTIPLIEGKFTISGDIPLDQGVYCFLPQGSAYFDFIIPENQAFQISSKLSDLKGALKFSNSTENAAFQDFLNTKDVVSKGVKQYRDKLSTAASSEEKSEYFRQIDLQYEKIRAINEKNFGDNNSDFTPKLIAAYCPPKVPHNSSGMPDSTFRHYYIKNHYFDQLDYRDQRMMRTPFFHGKFHQYLELFVYPTPDSAIKEVDVILTSISDPKMLSFIATDLLGFYANSKAYGKDKVFAHLAENYFLKKKIPFMEEATLQRISQDYTKVRYNLVGNVAPDFKLKDETGKEFTMSQNLKEYNLLYFWDTDCDNCQENLPEIQKLGSNYASKGLNIISICVNSNEGEWRSYLNTNALPGIQLFLPESENRLKVLYNIYGTPISYLLDQQGVILGKRLITSQVAQKLDDLINKKAGSETN